MFLTILPSLFFISEAAHAEAGYRVCGAFAYRTGAGGHLTRGLVSKIDKANKDDTCGKKINFMRTYYGNAYSGKQSTDSFRMITCEDLSQHMGVDADICKSMQANKIYKYDTVWDNYPKVTSPKVVFWHN